MMSGETSLSQSSIIIQHGVPSTSLSPKCEELGSVLVVSEPAPYAAIQLSFCLGIQTHLPLSRSLKEEELRARAKKMV